MRKYIVLAIYIASSMVSSFAQVGNQQMLKCVYLEEAINRADQPDKITQDEFVLLLKVTIPDKSTSTHKGFKI